MSDSKKYHITIKGQGFAFAFKRLKKTDDIQTWKERMLDDPVNASDFMVQGPSMDANVIVTDENGHKIIDDILDALDCNVNKDGLLPSDLGDDEVVVSYLCAADGTYLDSDFNVPVGFEMGDTGVGEIDGEDVGLEGEYIDDWPYFPGNSLFVEFGFMGSKFLFERPTSLRGPRVRVFDKDGEPFFVTGIRLQKIVPIDDMLERIIERHRLSLSDGEASDTEAFEKDVLGYIADLDMNELDSVEDEWEDGLYIDAKDPIYYKIVKDGKTLLAFEPLGDEDDRNEMNDALTFFDDGDEDEEE